jgi:C1A family cysteine protease
MQPKRILNFKISPADSRDYVAKASPVVALPATVDLSSYCTSVKDQGPVGSCTAFSCVGMMEYFLRKNGVVIPDDLLSESFLYYNTRVLIESTPATVDSGAYLRDVLKAMNRYGVCLEKTFPYSSNYSLKPTQTAYSEGMKYQVIKYANIPTMNVNINNTLNDLKTFLQNGMTFVGGIICYSNFFNGSNGMIPLPAGNIIGGHAVLFVGYDDNRKVFKFKNSWGKNWGDKGYGYLPYQYLLTRNLFDLWTVYGEEYNDALVNGTLVVPPSVRAQAVSDRVSAVFSSISQSIDSNGLGSIDANQLKSQLSTSNYLLLSSDIPVLSTMIDSVVTSVKTAQNKLGV